MLRRGRSLQSIKIKKKKMRSRAQVIQLAVHRSRVTSSILTGLQRLHRYIDLDGKIRKNCSDGLRELGKGIVGHMKIN